MAVFETLNHPPIVEAMLEVQVIFPNGVELERLAELHNHCSDHYPKKDEVRMLQFNFQQHQGEAPVASTHDHGIQGYRFFSSDGKQIIQCLQNGLIFNRLAPYGSWEDFIAEARSAWEFYRKAFPEAQVVRIGVRYINRILIPLTEGKADLEDYFTVKLPGPIDHGLTYTNFLEHSQFHDPKTGLGINWVFALQPSNETSTLPLVLDIGVYAVGNQAKENDPIPMWETMRELKNRLFFSSFTDKGKTLFK